MVQITPVSVFVWRPFSRKKENIMCNAASIGPSTRELSCRNRRYPQWPSIPRGETFSFACWTDGEKAKVFFFLFCSSDRMRPTQTKIRGFFIFSDEKTWKRSRKRRKLDGRTERRRYFASFKIRPGKTGSRFGLLYASKRYDAVISSLFS